MNLPLDGVEPCHAVAVGLDVVRVVAARELRDLLGVGLQHAARGEHVLVRACEVVMGCKSCQGGVRTLAGGAFLGGGINEDGGCVRGATLKVKIEADTANILSILALHADPLCLCHLAS